MSLIPLIENIFFSNGRFWGNLNASLYNSGPVWAMKTGIESADLNMVWNEKPLMPDDRKTISDIKTNFRQSGLPFWWWMFPGGQSRTSMDMLQAEGFSFVDGIPCMLADLSLMPDQQTGATDVSIIRVCSPEELALWETVSFSGFDFPPETKEQYHRFVQTFNLAAESPQQFLLACHNGTPVATSLLFLSGNACGIYFVTTLADQRKKGIGLAVTMAAMRLAKVAKARFATLQSSSDGYQVYKQAGFKEYCRVNVYSLKAG